MTMRIKNPVTERAAAPSSLAADHFQSKLHFETDCWDVHASQSLEPRGFVLLDVRSPELYAQGHLPGALSWPHGKLTAERLRAYPDDTLFVVYCAGPHCNGSTKAALRLAQLGRPVKELIGGVTGWLDEGFSLTQDGA